MPTANSRSLLRSVRTCCLPLAVASLVAAVVIKARKPSSAQTERALEVEAEEVPVLPGESTELPVVSASAGRLVDDVYARRGAQSHPSRIVDTRG